MRVPLWLKIAWTLWAHNLGTRLLAPLRTSEFPFLLRYRECADRNWSVVREWTDLLVGGLRLILFQTLYTIDIGGALPHRPPFDWRDGIHVRYVPATLDSSAELVSRRDTVLVCSGL